MRSEFSAEMRGPRPRGSSRTRPIGLASRAVIAGLAAAATAGLVAACSSGGTSQAAGPASAGPASAGPASPASASHGTVVSVRKLPGVGSVLVDRSGMTVYSAQQEAQGMIECTGGCLSVWTPVKAARGALHGSSGVTGTLGTIHRPDDGVTQLTVDGRPLYTFRLDHAPGQAHGNNFSDNFGGTSFTWHAITASGAMVQPSGSGSSGGGGYSTPSGSSGGYSGGG
jgi:predicted lipoprotein with Yx(FWY)xxD motif